MPPKQHPARPWDAETRDIRRLNADARAARHAHRDKYLLLNVLKISGTCAVKQLSPRREHQSMWTGIKGMALRYNKEVANDS